MAIGTWSFASVILKVALSAPVALVPVPIAAEVNTQFSIHSAQFLNATCVAAASGWFLRIGLSTGAAIVLVTAIFPVTKIYASE